jgi:hypothetical protein
MKIARAAKIPFMTPTNRLRFPDSIHHSEPRVTSPFEQRQDRAYMQLDRVTSSPFEATIRICFCS